MSKLNTWLLVAVFLLITFFQYSEQLGHPAFIANLTADLGLTRYTVERILYLIPIIWASLLLGWKGGAVVSLAALASMLPRDLLQSPSQEDAIVETMAVFIVGNLANFSIESLRKERQRSFELEAAQTVLRSQLQVIEKDENRLAALNQTSAIVSQSLRLVEILEAAVTCVADVMAAEVACIYILNPETGELYLAAHFGISTEFASSMRKLKLGEGYNGTVAKTGEWLITEDAFEGDVPTRTSIIKENIRSQLVVPLKSKGKVVGTLCVAMHSQRHFLPEEVDLLTAIGNQIGVAVENARLYQQEREVSEQLKFSEQRYRELFENAHDAIWLHDLAGNIITANKACARLTGYSLEELHNLRAVDLLSQDSLDAANNAEERLLKGDTLGSLADVSLIKKDGTRAIIQLAISLVSDYGNPTGFQHIARDLTGEKQMQENLRFLLQQVTRAQEEERTRIAQELHDDTVQALVAHCQQIDDFTSSIKGLKKEAKLRLENLYQDANNIILDVRRISQDLRPAALDNLGLVPALKWLGSKVAAYSGIAIDVIVCGNERKMSDEAELVLFRIAQEALQNVRKHSQAASAEITIEFNDSNTKLTIADNGKGFETPQDISTLPRYGKLGLAGMQQRAQLIGGTLSVKSQPGGGTILIAELPV